jgi:Ras-related protein Rab-5C
MPKFGKKLVLLGNAAVGKTSISIRLVKDRFEENGDSTIGAAYNKIVLDKVPIDIWDTAGQERYVSLTPMYYRGSDIVLLVYDLTDMSSADRLEYYLKKLITLEQTFGCIIVGTKKDLISGKVAINNMESLKQKFEKYEDVLPCTFQYINISSKSGDNIDLLRKTIVSLCGSYNGEYDLDTDIVVLNNEDWQYSDYAFGCNC